MFIWDKLSRVRVNTYLRFVRTYVGESCMLEWNEKIVPK